MSGRNRSKQESKKRRYDDLAEVHQEDAVSRGSKHSEQQVIHSSGELRAAPSDVLDTTLVANTLPGDLSGTSSARPDNSSEVSHAVDLDNNIKTEAIDAGSSEEGQREVKDDVCLLNAIDSDTSSQAVELLRSQNSFTQAGLNKALISACRRGHKLLVQTLVRVGANIEHPDEYRNTPLLICAERGFTDIVRFLVSRHADVNAVNSTGNTALILSVRSAGSTDLTRFLLEQPDIVADHKNDIRCTALIKAIEFMDVDIVRLLLGKIMTGNPNCKVGNVTEMNYGMDNFNEDSSQEMMKEIALRKTGRKKVYKILKKHILTGISPLVLAIEKNDRKSCDIFLDCQFSSSLEKESYVNSAAEHIFKRILKRDCDTSMCNASSYSEIEMLQRLMECGARVKTTDGFIPISVATEAGCFEVVELLCKHSSHFDNSSYPDNPQPLSIAAKLGRCDLIELLLKYQADINRYSFSDSPLDYSLRYGHTECAKLLIQRGAKMEVKGALRSAVQHQIPEYMHFLFENYKHEIMEYLSQKPRIGWKLLILAIQKGNIDIIGHILDAGADINEADSSGDGPLVMSPNRDVALFLIQRGAYVNQVIRHRYGLDTALIRIIRNQRCRDSSTVELGRVLVENSTLVNCRNGDGKTPLMIAAAVDDCVEMLEMLLDNGADVNDKDNEGNTALLHAAIGGHHANMSFLIQTSAEKKRFINVQNNKGLSPLMASAMKSNDTIIKELIDEGADVHMKDRDENTALHHLLINFYEKKEEILTNLVKAGSDVNCQNSEGLSPLMLAATRSMTSEMSSLLEAGADVNAVSKKNNSQTALSFIPIFDRFSNSTLSCIEALLDGGASSAFLNPECFRQLIFQKQMGIISKLIQHGLVPTDIGFDKSLESIIFPVMSPLCVALLTGNVSLARYFVDILFLTSSDLSMFARSKVMERCLIREHQDGSLNFLQELSSQPMSLFKLSLVTVSLALGASPGRESRVHSLPLPRMMKDRLLFQSDSNSSFGIGLMYVDENDDSSVQEWISLDYDDNIEDSDDDTDSDEDF